MTGTHRRTRRARTLVAAMVAAVAVTGVATDTTAAGQRPRQDRDERRQKEIELAARTLRLAPGETVAEIGAGDGGFSLRFAEIVGPQGRVFVNELDADDLARISRRAAARDLVNVVTVEGALDDTNLEAACCDAMMMRMVYHMLTQPEPMAASFFRALEPGGRLLILEGDPQPNRSNARGVPDDRAGMGIDPDIVVRELEAVGFRLERRIPDWVGADYALLFVKPASGSFGRR